MRLTKNQTRQKDLQSGFTIVEVAVALFILVVGVSVLTASVMSSMSLSRTNEETATATAALQAKAEEIQATNFRDIFPSFNEVTGDDPGVVPGHTFEVRGLNLQKYDDDGFVGAVEFPSTFPDANTQALREDQVNRHLGLPRDLNGDSFEDALNHAFDYVILPVTIRIEWTGVSGDREMELHLLLTQ